MRGRSLAGHFEPDALSRKAASAFLLRAPKRPLCEHLPDRAVRSVLARARTFHLEKSPRVVRGPVFVIFKPSTFIESFRVCDRVPGRLPTSTRTTQSVRTAKIARSAVRGPL